MTTLRDNIALADGWVELPLLALGIKNLTPNSELDIYLTNGIETPAAGTLGDVLYFKDKLDLTDTTHCWVSVRGRAVTYVHYAA